MSNTNPISILKPEAVTIIRTDAAAAEKHGKPSKKQLNLINESDWFKMLIPSAYGGKQLSLPDVMQVEEALACADGSMGWLVTLCAGAGWFGGFLNPEFAKKVFGTEKVCLAGSGATTGTADRNSDGSYVINGKWAYATGSGEATAFTANCQLSENGTPVKDASGKPKIVSFVFLKDEVTVNQDWNSFGMVATESNSFEVKDLTVAEERMFDTSVTPVVNVPLYHYPFLQFSEATLAINLAGMTVYFMELCGEIINDNTIERAAHVDMRNLQETFATLSNKLQTARQKLYYAVDMSWQVCAANKEVSTSVLYKVSAAAAACALIVRDCVNTLYPYCGMKASNKDAEINRVWRNIHTAGQHSLLAGDGSY